LVLNVEFIAEYLSKAGKTVAMQMDHVILLGIDIWYYLPFLEEQGESVGGNVVD
jgi:hypothetical protein